MVGPAGAEDRDLRLDSLQEFPAARRQAAVMRNLQYPERGCRSLAGERALHVPADVACQKHRHVPPTQVEHDRVVVPHLLPLPVGRRRMVRRDRHAVDEQTVAPMDVGPARPLTPAPEPAAP